MTHATKKATNDQTQLSHYWLHPPADTPSLTTSLLPEDSMDNHITPNQPVTPLSEGATSNYPYLPALAERPPLDDGNINQSSREDVLPSSPFVDIATLGLYTSSCLKQYPMGMNQINSAIKEFCHSTSLLILLILTALAFINPASSLCTTIPAHIVTYFQS